MYEILLFFKKSVREIKKTQLHPTIEASEELINHSFHSNVNLENVYCAERSQSNDSNLYQEQIDGT